MNSQQNSYQRFLMFKPLTHLTIMVCMWLGVSGCRQVPDTPLPEQTATATPTPTDEFDEYLRLTAPKEFNEFKLNTAIHLIIENTSKNTIWFPLDYGVQIFAYSVGEAKWVEVENRVNSISLTPSTGVLLKPHPEEGFTTTTVWPSVSETNESIDLRIVVAGNVYSDGEITDEEVSTYLDITLQP